jgi:hypothetical protein
MKAKTKKTAKKATKLDEKKIVSLFKSGKSTGEVCLAVGLPRSPASRRAVREVLRAADVYEKRKTVKAAKENA